jgi:hypothetical protein
MLVRRGISHHNRIGDHTGEVSRVPGNIFGYLKKKKKKKMVSFPVFEVSAKSELTEILVFHTSHLCFFVGL